MTWKEMLSVVIWIAPVALGGLGSLVLGRYLARRDERRKASDRYWVVWSHLMDQLGMLRSAINASHKVATEVRQHAWDAERAWRDEATVLLQVGNRAVAHAVTIHIQVTEQKIKATNRGEWPYDDGCADRGLHAAMRRNRLR